MSWFIFSLSRVSGVNDFLITNNPEQVCIQNSKIIIFLFNKFFEDMWFKIMKIPMPDFSLGMSLRTRFILCGRFVLYFDLHQGFATIMTNWARKRQKIKFSPVNFIWVHKWNRVDALSKSLKLPTEKSSNFFLILKHLLGRLSTSANRVLVLPYRTAGKVFCYWMWSREWFEATSHPFHKPLLHKP